MSKKILSDFDRHKSAVDALKALADIPQEDIAGAMMLCVLSGRNATEASGIVVSGEEMMRAGVWAQSIVAEAALAYCVVKRELVAFFPEDGPPKFQESH